MLPAGNMARPGPKPELLQKREVKAIFCGVTNKTVGFFLRFYYFQDDGQILINSLTENKSVY